MSIVHATLIEDISRKLEKVIALNALIVNENVIESKSVFDTKGIKEVSIKEYLQRIVKSTDMEKNTLKYALKLLKNYCKRNNFLLLKGNCFKLIFACCLVSIKIHEDIIYSDKDMALIGGIGLPSLIKIEYELLESFDYKVASV